jgi:hypothetical protein
MCRKRVTSQIIIMMSSEIKLLGSIIEVLLPSLECKWF